MARMKKMVRRKISSRSFIIFEHSTVYPVEAEVVDVVAVENMLRQWLRSSPYRLLAGRHEPPKG